MSISELNVRILFLVLCLWVILVTFILVLYPVEPYSPIINGILTVNTIVGGSFLLYVNGKAVWRYPGFILFFYLNINLLMGHIFFSNGWTYKVDKVSEVAQFNFFNYGLIYLVWGSFAICLSTILTRKGDLNGFSTVLLNKNNLPSERYFRICNSLFSCLLILSIGSLLHIELHIMAITVSVIIIVNRLLADCGRKLAIPFLIVVLLIFAKITSGSKRDLLFPLIIISMIFMSHYRGSLASVSVKVLISVVAMVSLIVLQTTMRSGMPVDGLLEAFAYVPIYLSDDAFLNYFGYNMEFSYVFYHFFKSIEVVSSGDLGLSYGISYLKAIGIGTIFFRGDIPSMNDIYTGFLSPAYRESGGSWPPSLPAALYINFYFFGVIAIFIITFLMNALTKYLDIGLEIKNSREFMAIFLVFLLHLMRGTDLSLAIFYLLGYLLMYLLITSTYFFIEKAIRIAQRNAIS